MEEQLNLFQFVKTGLIAGCDEAGRGPLAGPLAVAACILPPSFDTSILDDSKKLSEKRRFALEPIIKSEAVAYTVRIVSIEEIEEKNILQATLENMAQCYFTLNEEHPISRFLVDGNKRPKILDSSVEVEAIVKGDSKIAQIMAASILAKTARDRIMMELDKEYPQYGFAKNKGYGTKDHLEALKKYGITPIHRPSYLRKFLQKCQSETH